MANRIEIYTKVNDTRSEVMRKRIASFGFQTTKVTVLDVYTINKHLKESELASIASLLANPVSQTSRINDHNQEIDFDFALEIGFLPGVTDNIATTAKESIEDLLKTTFEDPNSIHSSQLIFIKGKLSEEDVKEVGSKLTNLLIQRVHTKSHAKFAEENGMNLCVPKVKLAPHPGADEIDLDIPEEELLKLGREGILDKDGTRRGPLALDKESLETIKEYFKKEGRKPTDIELESLAQTWSEHCKHTIFAAKIDDNKEGLYKGYIKKATREIRNKKGEADFCVSVFSDNSGGIIFDENWIVSDKAETHNSPSALDPFGGAITGIVGVNRDTIGFGMGAKPVINKYGYCVGYPEDEEPLYKDAKLENKALSPKRIFEGIIEGVQIGGNCSGIPTPIGFTYFDNGYKGKPLVFVGTVGLMPREVNGKQSWKKQAKPGDKVVVTGGRVGQDGIHGATFSSEALTSGSPATAVQIGDPITQKKLSDAIIKEARDMDLYNSITDCGAGGISCSVAEMGKECGGCHVELDKVPLKYPNLEPWKTWISESQERMTLSIPPAKLDQFMKLMKRRGVEAAVIGDFTDSGRCIVENHGKKIMDMDMDFLHDGLPGKELKTTYTRPKNEEPTFEKPSNLTETLHQLLQRPNIASFEFISQQYDHTVQAGAVVGPLQGKGRVNGTASVTKPVLDSEKGVVCSEAITARYSYIDTYHMAASAIDTAVRQAVAVGAPLDHLALMDNFCWCSSDEKERLGQLKAAAQACYDYAVAYGTPFISGKDSMFNDFKGFDKDGNPVKISVPPTLMISSFAVMKDVTKAVSIDPKIAGDLVYVIGETKNELGASEYFYFKEEGIGNSVPQVNAEKALETYQKYEKALNQRLIASSFPISIGGIGVALAKKAIAGQLGMQIDLSPVPKSDETSVQHEKSNSADSETKQTSDLDREDYLLFSETQSRFIVTIDPNKKDEFEKIFEGTPFAQIGEILEDKIFIIKGFSGDEIIRTNVKTLDENYKKTFKDY